MLSEYAVGPFGRVMAGAFYALSASYLALLVVLLVSGVIGHDLAVGWRNRLFIDSHAAWVIVLAWRAGHQPLPANS